MKVCLEHDLHRHILLNMQCAEFIVGSSVLERVCAKTAVEATPSSTLSFGATRKLPKYEAVSGNVEPIAFSLSNQ